MTVYNKIFTLSQLTEGTDIRSINDSSYFSTAMNAVTLGDVNGDGFLDFAFSSRSRQQGQDETYSKLHVIFGTQDGVPSDVDLNNIDESEGFTITISNPASTIGLSIRSIGDYNEDGFDDFMFSTSIYGNDPFGNGNSYLGNKIVIFYGGDEIPNLMDFNNLPEEYAEYGSGYSFGGHTSGGADFNGDSNIDTVSSSYRLGIFEPEKRAFVNLGDQSYEFIVPKKRHGNFEANFVGDVNGDGRADIAVSSPSIRDVGMRSVSIFFGVSQGETPETNAANLNGTNGFTIQLPSNGALINVSTRSAGDFNGDGIGDLIITAGYASRGNDSDGYNESSRDVFVVFGTNDPSRSDIDLSELDTWEGFQIVPYYDVGKALSVGDFNGDGLDDIAFESRMNPDMPTPVTVLYGTTRILPDYLDLATLNPNEGFSVQFKPNKPFLGLLSGAGDTNGDGNDDIFFQTADGVKLLLGRPSNVGIEGDNYLEGTSAAELIDGEAGHDTILGFAGNDLLTGGIGNDILDGGTGIDTLQGGDGDDVYVIDHENDTLFDSGGRDQLRSDVLSIALWQWTGIEDARLSGFLDLVLAGDDADNSLWGNSGANSLYGNNGSDQIFGGDGADTIVGGAGADALFGGAGNDVIYVDSRSDTVRGGDGDNIMASDNISIDLNSDNFDVFHAALFGTRKLNLTGNNGGNALYGNDARNVIRGGGGVDGLYGNGGSDTLIGGNGIDFFVLDTGYGQDRVKDFKATGRAHDRVDVRDIKSIKNFADLQKNHLRQIGDDVVVVAGKDRLILENTDIDNLTQSHFLI
ncbi:calcium-binding protein [Neogemmobacter tilapiae]|uniref:Calcium-binding protein n=1 Tax=Neogemmobacter tilapiae TaxID=875041 RepID=A0A918TY95_9RHOB|nr:calcium-binding protein [Gemmobacter tilapiae]GHC67102.1 hypothetical protein GCM10007315_35120 [Gemmobacter tilapiae]